MSIDLSSLESRLKHTQDAALEVGKLASSDVDPLRLMSRVVSIVAEAIEADRCEVWQPSDDGQSLCRVASAGWPETGDTPEALPVDSASRVGFCLTGGDDLSVENALKESRFEESPLFIVPGLLSGVCALIGDRKHPAGVLAAHSEGPGSFSEYDLSFLHGIAGILAASIARGGQHKAPPLPRPSKPGGVVIFSVDAASGLLLHISPACAALYGLPLEAFTENPRLWREIAHPDDWPALDQAINQQEDYGVHSVSYRVVRPFGDVRWVEGRVERQFDPERTTNHVNVTLEDVTDRIQMRETLRATEEDYQRLFDNITEVSYVIDRQWRYRLVNQAASRATRVNKRNLIGFRVQDVFPGFDGTLQHTAIRQTLEGGLPQRFTSSHILPGGTPEIFEVFVFPIRDGVMCIARDTTDRNRAEAAERERRALAEAFQQTAAALSSILNSDQIMELILENIGKVVSSEAAYLILFERDQAKVVRFRGYGQQSMKSSLPGYLVALDDVPYISQMKKQRQPLAVADTTSETGWPATPELKWIRSCALAPITSDGNLLGCLMIASSASAYFEKEHADRLKIFADQAAIALKNARLYEAERKERILAQKLRETAEALAGAPSLADALNMVADGVRNVVQCDWALIARPEDDHLRILSARGMPRPEDFVDVLFPLTASPILAETLVSKQIFNIDLRPGDLNALLPGMLAPSRSVVGMPLTVNEVTIGFLSIGSAAPEAFDSDDLDVVRAFGNQAALAIEKNQILEQLQTSLRNLREAQHHLVRTARLSAAGEVAAGVAHQINNPLTTVIAQAHLLQLRIPEDHPAFKSARTIYEASMRAAQVVERMLDLARTNTYDVRPLDVNRTLRSALSLLAGQIDADRLELVTDFDEEIPEISASALHLEDVWINLMINARDAIGPERHGRIEVRTRWHPRMQMVEVNIKDNGPGIPPEHRDQLFNPFFTTKTRGTGLGLSICHEVIIYHGGTIEVAESSPQGTTFRVMLPVSPPDLNTVRDGEKNQL